MGLEPRFNCYIGIDYSGAETATEVSATTLPMRRLGH